MFEGQDRSILLVEDEALIAMSEKMMLEKRGLQVHVVNNGQQAIDVATNSQPIDLILMDIDLGNGIDGTEAATRILEHREIPIVFLTSHSEEEMVRKVKGITRYGYVLKNSGEFVLVEAIQSALELFEARRELEREVEDRRLAEDQLERRNTFIQTILDNLPIGLAVNFIDDGRATYMNRQFESIYGWPSRIIEDIPTFFERVYPDPQYRTKMFERISEDIASGDAERMVWRGVEITRQSGEKAIVVAMNIPIYDQNFMISTVTDVTENQALLSNLAESEARYRTLSKSLPNGMIALFDSDLRFIEVGGSVLENGPLSSDDFVGKRLRDIYPEEIADRDEPSLKAALRGETTDQIVANDGQYYRVITAPIDNGDDVRNGLILTQDITTSQLAINENSEVLEKLNLAIETAGLGIWTLDLESRRLEWNDRLVEIYGLDRSEFEESQEVWMAMVHPDDRALVTEAFEGIVTGQQVRDLSFRIRRPDGEIRHISASGAPVQGKSALTTIIGINVDVTEMVEREEMLKDAISRQETQMREASHRIKNSLMTVQSLISLAEANQTGFASIGNQINAIAAVHDSLGRAATLEHIEIGSLLETITRPYADALQKRGVRFDYECQEQSIQSGVAVPVALIINELVSNAVRHGIGKRTNGFVKVAGRSDGKGLWITVENDGHLLPDDSQLSSSGSLGWQLVHALVAQVGGNVSIERDPYTSITLVVPDVV